MDANFPDANVDAPLQGMLDDLRSWVEQLTNFPAGQLSLGYIFQHTIFSSFTAGFTKTNTDSLGRSPKGR